MTCVNRVVSFDFLRLLACLMIVCMHFVLGYYCHTYPERLSMCWLAPAVMVAMAIPAICKLGGLLVDFYAIFWYLSPFVTMQCLFWWKVVSDMIVITCCEMTIKLDFHKLVNRQPVFTYIAYIET